MRLMDYKLFSQEERLQYLSSQKMTTGIPYFGGKSKIGKYIYNTIFNMAVTMHDNKHKPLIFVDAFTGGGKMALSMPDGWFKIIVMNDLDYGVYCYYKCCQENYRLLLATVDKLVDSMSEQMLKKCIDIREDKQLDPYMCGAMTYLACALSYNNTIGKAYKPTMGENSNEKQELDKVKARAHKTIIKVAKQFKRRDYIIENLDYIELINKYTGKSWTDTDGIVHEPIEDFSKVCNNTLFYMDPPYYEATLSLGEEAPYTHTFTTKETKLMTNILTTNENLVYWIKSDYDPKATLKTAEELKDSDSVSESLKRFYESRLKEPIKSEMEHIFDSIEDESKGFQKICVGGFDKGAILQDGETSIGLEYIWTKGLPTGYKDIPKVVD